jgi:hypothetical protein
MSSPAVAEAKVVRVFCPMCGLPLKGAQNSYSLACGHAFCFGCWGDYLVQWEESDTGGEVTCIHRGCRRVLDPDEVDRLDFGGDDPGDGDGDGCFLPTSSPADY